MYIGKCLCKPASELESRPKLDSMTPDRDLKFGMCADKNMSIRLTMSTGTARKHVILSRFFIENFQKSSETRTHRTLSRNWMKKYFVRMQALILFKEDSS